MYDEEKVVTCKMFGLGCGWTGKRKECNVIEVNTPKSAWIALAGREGWEFSCPECGQMVDSYYTRMS